jgi:hypothetical protein
MAAFKALVLRGPDVEKDGVSAWTAKDLCRLVEERYGESYSENGMLKLLHGLDLSWQKTRPAHPKAVSGRSGPRGVGRRCLFPVDGDEFFEVLDAVLAEGRRIIFAASVDGDDTVFRLHVDDDRMEEVFVLIEHLGDTGEGEDVGDGGHAQAAFAVACC